MMDKARMARLCGITRILRDVELAGLARLSVERQKLEDARQNIVETRREALEAGLEAPDLGRQTERFAAWSTLREIEIEARLQKVELDQRQRKEQAAKALGRARNMEQIAQHLRSEAKLRAGRRS